MSDTVSGPAPNSETVSPGVAGLSWSISIPARDAGPAWDWQHYDLVHTGARSAIEQAEDLSGFGKAVLIGLDESPRIAGDGTMVAGVIPAYARTGDADEHELTSWHFAMTPTHLVTGRRRSTRSLYHIWDGIQHRQPPAGPAAVLHQGIAYFAREVRGHLTELSAELDPIEDLLIEPERADSLADLASRIGATRREATRLSRVLMPLARALDEDELEHLPAWALPPADDHSLRLVRMALDDIAALYDRARSLQDELAARLAEETNRRLYLVSVATSLAIPITMITGFFGMKTGGMLWGGEDMKNGTIYATLVCIGSVLAVATILRLKRLL
jgi:zinc transporter